MKHGNVLNQMSSKENGLERINERPEGQVACISTDAVTTQGRGAKNGTEPTKKEAGEVLLRPLNRKSLLEHLCPTGFFLSLGIHNLSEHLFSECNPIVLPKGFLQKMNYRLFSKGA